MHLCGVHPPNHGTRYLLMSLSMSDCELGVGMDLLCKPESRVRSDNDIEVTGSGKSSESGPGSQV